MTLIYLNYNLITLNLIMQYQLFLTIDYPKSASSSLEQSRLYQTTQVSVKKMIELMNSRFFMLRVIPEMEYLQNSGPKTVLLTILVPLMTIETTTALPDKGQM